MQAMLLAAGFGTRLRPYTFIRPKPLFPVLNRPLLLILLDMLHHSGFTRIVVNGHYLADQIETAVAEVPDVRFQYEPEVLGIGGGLRRALPEFTDEPVLVMNGDTLHTIDLAALYDYHITSGNLVTLAMHDCPRFNTVLVKDERILTFQPDQNKAKSELLAFTGIQIVDPLIIRRIPDGRFYQSIDVYEDLARRGEKIGIYRVDDCFWRDMGTPRDYLTLHEELLAGKIKLPFEFSSPGDRWLIDEQARLEAGVDLVDWGCIGNARVGRDARLQRCVVWDGASVAPGSRLKDAIVTP